MDSVLNMSLKQLRAFQMPNNPTNFETFHCKTVVIVPMTSKHDSGFRNIKLIATDEKNIPTCVVTEGSDDIRLDGIGGIRYSNAIHSGWAIDCLPKSGVMRLHGPKSIKFSEPYSSIDVFGSNE